MAPRTTPPFRADHVGSLLRPPALHRAREAAAAGRIDADALRAVEDDAIREAVHMQREVGLQAVTDGEFRRATWHLDFIYALDGISTADDKVKISFHNEQGDIEFMAAALHVDGRVGVSETIFGDAFSFLQECADGAVPKLTIPSPSALLGRPLLPPIDASVYPDREELYADLGAAYRVAVRAFAAAGCRYLQLDEVFIAMLCDIQYRDKMIARGDDPAALLPLYAQLINPAIAEAPPDMTITLHLCRGNFKSTYMGAGGYEAVEDVLFNELDVDGYFMEYDDERSGGFEPLRLLPKGKRVALGLVTTKRGKLESKDDLKRRIDAAAKFTDVDRLCLAPQCGFASTEEGNVLTEAEQWAKLALIVEVAEKIWGSA